MRESEGPAQTEQVGKRDIARNTARFCLRTSILLTSLALAACQTDGTGMASANGGLAFVSIDGPPKPTFDKLVSELSTEAQSRQVKVASRDDPGAYRVKGYLSMHVERGKASVAYAWDVYDPSKTRVARITGEENAGPVKGSTGWAACNDAVLAKIADRSMAELSETLGVGGSAPAVAAEPAVAAVAPAREAPEAAPQPTTPATEEAPTPATAPPPAEAPTGAPAVASTNGGHVAALETTTPALAYAAN